jgi:hypothetical protein
MKQRFKIELYYVFGIIVFTSFIALWIFGEEIFSISPLDIQLYDTYFVIDKTLFLATVFIFLMTATYLIRSIYFRLKIK